MDIEQLAKTTAEAVATLAALVEGLPKAVDAKLAAYHASVKDAVAEVTKQIGEIRGDHENLRAFVESTRTSFLAAAETVADETRQIIAGNQKATDEKLEQLGLRLDDTVKMLVTAESGMVKMLEGAKAEATAQVAEVHAVVEGVQTSLAGYATAQQLKDVEGGLAALESKFPKWMPTKPASCEEVEQLRSVLGELDKRLSDSITDVGSAVADAAGREVELRSSIDAIGAGVNEKINELTTRATNQADATSALCGRVDEVAAVAAKAAEDFAMVPAVIETSVQAVRSSILDAVGVAHVALRNSVEANAQAIGALTAKLDDAGKDTLEKFVAVETALREADAEITQNVEALAAAVAETKRDLDITQGHLIDTATKLDTGLAATREAVQAVEESVRGEIEAADNKLEAELRGHIGASVAGIKSFVEEGFRKAGQGMQEAGEGMQAMSSAVAELAATVAAKADEATVARVQEDLDAVSKAHDALAKTVGELPEPVDATELEVRLGAKLAEMIPEHASLELPAPEIDAHFQDGVLVVGVTMGEKTATASMPVPVCFDYKGVYDKAKDYVTGNFVTHRGGIWYAKSKPTGEPGKDITGWQLAVKPGRDGKDATPTRSYVGHEEGRVYRETDFLRINNRLWQCAVKEATTAPAPDQIFSDKTWTLVGVA